MADSSARAPFTRRFLFFYTSFHLHLFSYEISIKDCFSQKLSSRLFDRGRNPRLVGGSLACFLSNYWSLMWQSLDKNSGIFKRGSKRNHWAQWKDLSHRHGLVFRPRLLLKASYEHSTSVFQLESARQISSCTYSSTSPLFTPRLYRDGSTTSSSPLASSPMRELNLILLPFRFYFLLFTFLRVSFHPAAIPSIRSLFMPRVGGQCRRWEVRARVCACNHGNSVLIGRRSGRMIVSCCQWRLFVQTCGRFVGSQMGPSATRRKVYPPSSTLSLLKSVLEEGGSCWESITSVVLGFWSVCVFSQLVFVCGLKSLK